MEHPGGAGGGGTGAVCETSAGQTEILPPWEILMEGRGGAIPMQQLSILMESPPKKFDKTEVD